MLELLDVLEKVFSMHVPWHSENDKLGALSAIQNARNEITGDVPEKLVPNEEETPAPLSASPADTATVPVAGTADAAADTTTNATSAIANTPGDANAVIADVTAIPAATYGEPEATPFPGSYTPPPA